MFTVGCVLNVLYWYIITCCSSRKRVKVRPRTDYECPESVYYFFNLGARWGGWLTPRSGRFTSGNDQTRIV